MLKYNIQGDQGMVYWLTCIPEDLEKTNNNDQSITSKGVNVWYIHLHLPQQTLAFHATQTYHTWIPYGYWTLLSIMLATGMCYIKLSSSKRLAYTLAVHHCWSLHLRISKMKSSWENQHPPPIPPARKEEKTITRILHGWSVYLQELRSWGGFHAIVSIQDPGAERCFSMSIFLDFFCWISNVAASLVGGFQPIWKNMLVKLDHFLEIGVNIYDIYRMLEPPPSIVVFWYFLGLKYPSMR